MVAALFVLAVAALEAAPVENQTPQAPAAVASAAPAPAVAPVAAPAQAATPAPTEASFVVGPQTMPDTQGLPRPKRDGRPWLELSAGPMAMHHAGIRGLASGPGVRLSVGVPFGEKAAAELWGAGTVQSPRGVIGSEGAAGGGLSARYLLHRFDGDGRWQLFGRAGAGWMAATTQGAPNGLSAFAGTLLLLQPRVKRFAFGLEVDAVNVGKAFGFAVLPTMRCGL